ncbi:MAG: ATP-binding protein [Bacteroidota bacterium]
MTPNLQTTLQFIADLTRHRLGTHFDKEIPLPEIPEMLDDQHPFTELVLGKKMLADEYVAVAVGLVPHIDPTFFDKIVAEFLPPSQTDFKPLGGYKSSQLRTFLPTGETVLFLLADGNLEQRIATLRIFDPDHYFASDRILQIEGIGVGEPVSSGQLVLDTDWVERILFGKVRRPRFGIGFPAERVETKLAWEDLVLPASTLQEIEELQSWLQHGATLMEDEAFGRRLKPGYRALFWGPPGTGKTFTAGLLGKHAGRDVYKIDLSMVVSKYIGETEKNLSRLFDKAENKDWILFFDEADALFGKRTNVRDAHDKHANQEVSYLLQRVENYNGLVILASNYKSNIDDAFMRRFQSIIHFPMPRPHERKQLWQKSMPAQWDAKEIELEEIALKYEITGASILNVVQFACLRTLARNDSRLSNEDMLEGIAREFKKEGKSA